MAKYLLCTLGTPGGDLMPCVAIARELVRRGHRVTIASHENYRAVVQKQGIAFIGLLPVMDREKGARWFEYATESRVKEWKYLIRDLIMRHFEYNLNQLSRKADFDVVVCGGLSFFGHLLGEKLGKVWGTFTYQPLVFEAEFRPTRIIGRTWRVNFLRRVTLPDPCARLLYMLGVVVFETWMAPVKKVWKSLGFPPFPRFIIETVLQSPHFNFALFSGVFAKATNDWPQPLIQTGFVWDRQDKAPLSNRMLTFLEKGDPPLLFALGSFGFATTRGREFFETAVQFCVAADRRAIFVVGTNPHLLAERGNDNIVISEYEPFPELLPRVSMLVHMGGMATIAAGLRAGKPQVLVPFSYEQCDNALRLEGLGLSRTLPIARCTLSSLARDIELADTDTYRKRAEEARVLVKDEDGAGAVADYLETIMDEQLVAPPPPITVVWLSWGEYMLRFAEEVILLTFDEKKGVVASGMLPRQFSIVLAGAVLMDLALENRIDTDLDNLVLVDSTPTGDAILDSTLARVAASAAPRSAGHWIRETAKGSEEIRETALAGLRRRGIIESDWASEGFVLSTRVSMSRRYPTGDGDEIEEVRLRVMRILFADDIPSPHDVVLICLADACNIFPTIFTKSELDKVRGRIALIRKMDLLGRTVARALQAFDAEFAPQLPQVRPWTDLPCPRQLPIIGNLADVVRDMRRFFTDQYRAFGPIFRIRILGTDLVIMAGPEANRFVAKGNNYFCNYEMWSSFNSYLRCNKSLIGIDGPEHLQMRRDHASFYSRKLIEDRMPEAVGIVEREIADWPLGTSVTGFRTCQRIVAEQIGFLATGLSTREYIDDIIRFSRTMLGTHVSRHVPKVALKLPRFRRSHKRVEEFIRNVLDAHAAGRREDLSSDLIDSLLEINARQPHYISEADLKTFILGPFLAGLDTAAASCAFMLYEALKNPQLLKTITEEADALFRDGTPAFSDLRSLDVMQRTMRETLRMYPLTVTVMRRVANSFEFQGYSIPAGTDVLIPFSLPHSMEEYWSNPSEFDVERFGKERAEHTKQQGIYEPYGVGAHACLGSSLAEALILINIATILHHFELDLDPPGYKIQVRQVPGLHPRSSLKFRLAKKRA